MNYFSVYIWKIFDFFFSNVNYVKYCIYCWLLFTLSVDYNQTHVEFLNGECWL